MEDVVMDIEPGADHLADVATGVELELIELVARREEAQSRGESGAGTDAAITGLQDRLAEIADRV